MMFTLTPPVDTSGDRYQGMLLDLLWRLSPPFYNARARDFYDYTAIIEIMMAIQRANPNGKVANRVRVLRVAMGPADMDIALMGGPDQVEALGKLIDRNASVIANDALQEMTVVNRITGWVERNPVWTFLLAGAACLVHAICF
jgi:hypothetical protein